MEHLKTSPAPPDAREIRVWVLTNSTQLRTLRAELYQELIGSPMTDTDTLDDVPEKMMLVVTELATNAMRHGLPPSVIRLMSSGDQFVLDVADHDPDAAPILPGDRQAEAGGRGLQLARSFSLDVGWYATEHTKHIWATFPMHPDA